jgi:ATP adenylyltransferase
MRAVGYEQIWAPWRLGYILGQEATPEPAETRNLLPGADPQCFLCQGVAGGADRQRLVVRRDEHVITVMNRYPYNNGHLLVAPMRHLARLDQLNAEVQLALSRMITEMVGLLEKVVSPEGFNIGLNLGKVAGAGLPGHVHWHLVPRWNGDTNFMPAIAAVNVIPQSLEALWEALTGELAKG